MLCQNCERPIEPAVEQCPHCGAMPLHRRVFMGYQREEFALTAEEEPFEIGESRETQDWPISPGASATGYPQIEERSHAQDHEVRWGGFFRRACAFVVDLVVILALASVMVLLTYIGYKVGLSAHGRSVTWGNVKPLLIFLSWGGIGLATVYFVLFHGMEGKTIGKWLLGLKVVGAEQGAITYRRAFLRWLATVGLAPLALGFLWVLWSREKRAWHDYLAGTWVIRG
ncbi:MAG: RDD family protein [Deltaproteobacteria bacterium]|nr:RDD family protein [Deltaproteobacteria bacterium]